VLQAAPAIGGPFSDCDVDDQALVLRVAAAPIEASCGAYTSSFSVGEQLCIEKLDTLPGLEPLSFRFRERDRASWPSSHRFQSLRRTWRVNVVGTASKRPCVLQMTIVPVMRTLDNVDLDIDDARDSISYATRFNLHQQRQQEAEGGDTPPCLRVAAPVACTVLHTSFPAMIPVGTACTLIPYPLMEVQKYVFDGSEDFQELPQAYFHYAAFASNGKEMVCDIQGGELDTGDFLLIDPCVLRTELPKVSDLVHAVAVNAVAAATSERAGTTGASSSRALGPTAERFDALHPRCAQVCRGFDPQRRSVKRNAGACGMIGGACGLGG